MVDVVDRKGDVGASQPAASASAPGERRQVTAMFYDIVNSTSLLNSMDPEDFGLLQRKLHEAAAAAIRHHGGHLDRMLGDGGCAYFGYPTADEDAAENAVAAALDLVDRTEKLALSANLASEAAVRVGVATSIVVIASTQGANLPGDVEIIGIAPVMAARLQSEADPNTVAVADTTYGITSHIFDFQALGGRSLKGFGNPVRLWRPLARRASSHRFSASGRLDAPLIDRSEQSQLCRDLWARACAGRGQIAFLSGEPGIGKSRFAAELCQELARDGAAARIFQCQPRANLRPLHPILDGLRDEIMGLPRYAAHGEGTTITRYFAQQGATVSARSAQLIGFLLDAHADQSSEAAAFSTLGADELRRCAVDAAVEILDTWAKRKPLLVILEDTHWADTVTEAFLVRMCEAIVGLPILMVVTTRDEPSAGLLDHPHVRSIPLPRLSEAAMASLIGAIWDRAPTPLASFIHRKSDGIPLFGQELVLLLKERFGSHASATEKDWEQSLRQSGVTTLQDLISARLAGLGDARRVSQVASVIGRDFSYDLLTHIAGRQITPATLNEALAQLVSAGILTRRDTEEGLGFRFRHVLVHEAAYESLLKAERRTLHAAIVECVGARTVSAPPDELMAWHCEQAGRPLDAARYAIQAAEACAARSAISEASQLLDSGEAYLGSVAPDPRRDDLMLRLLGCRGPVAIALYGEGSPEARAVYERGVAASQQREAHERERWFPLYWGWWFTAPDFASQQVRSRVLVSDLEQASDPEIRLQALHCAWATGFHAGRHHECLYCVEQGLDLYDAQRAVASRTRFGGHDAKVCALGERALSLWFMGEDGAASQSIGEALEWADQTEHLGSVIHALEYALFLSRYRCRYDDALDFAGQIHHIAEQHGLPGPGAKARMFRGWAAVMNGSTETGFQEFEAGLEVQRTIGTEENLSIFMDMKSEILSEVGRPDTALQILNETIASSERAGQLFWLAELYRRRAVLLKASGATQGIWRTSLQRALALAREQNASVLADRVRRDFDRLSEPLLS